MKGAFLSRYTPSLMTSEALEAVFVQREGLAERMLELIHDSALTESKHHTLLIGPRGIGKTHLIALVYHRLRAMEDLRDHLLIAWLREEEWGVTSFLDLLLRIFRALLTESQNASLAERVESLYNLSSDAAERMAAELLKEFVGDRTLLLLVENLDDLFGGLGDEGQKRLRAYLQEHPFCTILATAQSLFNGVSLQTSPFYGFFRIHHLKELDFDDVPRLLTKIADFEGDRELTSFLQTPEGRARVRAVHHLAGGNHRVYVIFSQFLTRESLDELAEPFMRTLDDLTLYYQERMARLSLQQRKMVEFLCDRRHPIPVKEIAQRCFMTHQTASGQLKALREMGYVRSIPLGRASYYELREALMRLCVEVKKQRGQPIRLFVDFLRLWYSQAELQQRLTLLQPDTTLEREYVLRALQVSKEEIQDPRVMASLQDYNVYIEKGNFARAFKTAEELVAIRGEAPDLLKQGYSLGSLGRHEEALVSFDKATELDPKDAEAWRNRGIALARFGRHEEALVSFDKATELDSKDAEGWLSRGIALGRLGRHEEALGSYDKAIELEPKDAVGWLSRGIALGSLGRHEEALVSYDKVIELEPKVAMAWRNQGVALGNLGRHEEALVSYDKVIELDPKNAVAWFNRGTALGNLDHYGEALASYDKAIELDPKDAAAWLSRGVVLGNLGRPEEALESFDKAIELDPKDAVAWFNRGIALGRFGRHEEALGSYDKAIELEPKDAVGWLSRGIALGSLGRHEEALVSYDKAIELDPKDALAWANRGTALNRLRRYAEALVSCDKAIELNPKNAMAWYDRGVALIRLGRYDEALVAFDKVIELDPKDAMARVSRGAALGYLGCYDEALASFDKAIELDPNDTLVWVNRGLALGNLGRYNEALASYDKAIVLGEQSSLVFFNRAETLLALNRWDEGCAVLDDALRRFALDIEHVTGHTGAIIRKVFISTHDIELWRTQVTSLMKLYDKHQVLSALAQGLVRSISALTSPMVSDTAAQTWLDVWRELAGDRPEFELPLRLLDVAVRYLKKQDVRILLELSVEERSLLEQVLEIEEPSET